MNEWMDVWMDGWKKMFGFSEMWKMDR